MLKHRIKHMKASMPEFHIWSLWYWWIYTF